MKKTDLIRVGFFSSLCAVALVSPGSAKADCPEDCDGDGVDAIAVGGTDCDDNDPNNFPSNAELCDVAGHDEDCDPDTVGNRDLDDDGFVDASCCNGDNCPESDCDDLVRNVNANAPEVCNGVDDDCDGLVDEDLLTTFFLDSDGDGFGQGAAEDLCPGNYSGLAGKEGDCDDFNAAIVPGAQRCTGVGTVAVCTGDGAFVPAACGSGERCVAQPNGAGVCMAKVTGNPH
jgi:putative metal-binding protein